MGVAPNPDMQVASRTPEVTVSGTRLTGFLGKRGKGGADFPQSGYRLEGGLKPSLEKRPLQWGRALFP